MAKTKGTVVAGGIDETSIKRAVASRAEELGGGVSYRDVTLEFLSAEVAPGCRVFRASWGMGERQGSLTGLIRDHDAPDTYPAQALGKIFRRWIETEGRLPNARLAATVSAYLFEPSRRHTVIVGDEDKAALIKQEAWLPHVRPPEVMDYAGQPGITFWWVGPRGASRMRVYLAEDSRIRTEETFIQDLLAGDVLGS